MPRVVKKIATGTKVPVTLTTAEKELIAQETFADEAYVKRLKRTPNGRWQGGFTLDDLDDLTGFIAASANHANDKKLGKKLDALWDRLTKVMNSYDDGGWGRPE